MKTRKHQPKLTPGLRGLLLGSSDQNDHICHELSRARGAREKGKTSISLQDTRFTPMLVKRSAKLWPTSSDSYISGYFIILKRVTYHYYKLIYVVGWPDWKDIAALRSAWCLESNHCIGHADHHTKRIFWFGAIQTNRVCREVVHQAGAVAAAPLWAQTTQTALTGCGNHFVLRSIINAKKW